MKDIDELSDMELIDNYPQLAARTAGDWHDEDHLLMNRLVGAGQETLELALAAPGELERREGDVPWYVSQAAVLLGYDWDELVGDAIEFAHISDLWNFRDMVELGNWIVSTAKKVQRRAEGNGIPTWTMQTIITQTPGSFEQLHDNLLRAFACAITLAEEDEVDLAQMLRNNLHKLAARPRLHPHIDYSNAEMG